MPSVAAELVMAMIRRRDDRYEQPSFIEQIRKT